MGVTPAVLTNMGARATARPWVALIEDYGEGTVRGSMFITADPSDRQEPVCTGLTVDDAMFIVAAVNALPALLSEIETLRKVRDAAKYVAIVRGRQFTGYPIVLKDGRTSYRGGHSRWIEEFYGALDELGAALVSEEGSRT